MACILFVDDERDLVWAVRQSLSDEEHEVLTAYNGEEALALARRARPDLVILDIVMPGLDGLQVCQQLRRDPTTAAIPILFLSMRGAVADRIEGLDRGGDDYLTKPFDLGELKARIRALLRRARAAPASGEAQDSVLVAGPLALDLHSREVTVRGKTVQLTPAEFDLLHYLMTHPGQVFSSQQLLVEVWGYSSETADPGLVRWHIANLRAKIEDDPGNPTIIRTLRHHGYLLERRRSTR